MQSNRKRILSLKLHAFLFFLKNKADKSLQIKIKALPLHSQLRNGTLAERLGNGLQNRVEQFDSARYLIKTSS